MTTPPCWRTPVPARRAFRCPLPGDLDGILVEFPAGPLTAEQWAQFLLVLGVWRPALVERESAPTAAAAVSLQSESETAP